MVFYLVLITFFVFVIFWLGDLILTVKTIKHLGHKAEINPILRLIFKYRGKFIYILKPIELALFLYLLWYVTRFSNASFFILLAYIGLYALLVVNNAHIYYKVTGKESLVFKVIYIGAVISIIFFIYLNYLLFQDLGKSFNALNACGAKYSELYTECELGNKTADITLERDLSNLFSYLNLTIRR